MKEKEKKKEEARRSPDRRRRSKERSLRGSFRTSPYSSRSKDSLGYHDKRTRSRERDRDRRWSRYIKTGDKERDDRERDRERDKEPNYRLFRRSKSIDRNSRLTNYKPLYLFVSFLIFQQHTILYIRSRSHTPRRYRSPRHKVFTSNDK